MKYEGFVLCIFLTSAMSTSALAARFFGCVTRLWSHCIPNLFLLLPCCYCLTITQLYVHFICPTPTTCVPLRQPPHPPPPRSWTLPPLSPCLINLCVLFFSPPFMILVCHCCTQFRFYVCSTTIHNTHARIAILLCVGCQPLFVLHLCSRLCDALFGFSIVLFALALHIPPAPTQAFTLINHFFLKVMTSLRNRIARCSFPSPSRGPLSSALVGKGVWWCEDNLLFACGGYVYNVCVFVARSGARCGAFSFPRAVRHWTPFVDYRESRVKPAISPISQPGSLCSLWFVCEVRKSVLVRFILKVALTFLCSR